MTDPKRPHDAASDDGRSIVDMDVEGVPANVLEPLWRGFGRTQERHRDLKQSKQVEAESEAKGSVDLTKQEQRTLILNSYLAALFLLLVFAGVLGLIFWLWLG